MVTVRDGEGRSLSVMAYIMDERFREPMLPTDSYYNGILEVYRQNGPACGRSEKGVGPRCPGGASGDGADQRQYF